MTITVSRFSHENVALALPGYLQSEYRDFKILVKIGEGGLSSVYRGVAVKPELQQRANGQLIAVKVMNGSCP